MKHYLLIRSAYDNHWLSSKRLALSERTIIACLKRQTRKDAVICLRMDDHGDPNRQKRLEMFTDTGFDIQTTWDIPEGRRLTTRVDDDDAIAHWFLEDTLAQAECMQDCPDTVLSWPNGFVWCGGRLRPWTLAENMFASLLSDSGTIMDTKHRHLPGKYPIHLLAMRRAWVWVRHSTNKSELAKNHLKHRPARTDPATLPFAVNWDRLGTGPS